MRMDERVEAIRRMRTLSERFIGGELPFGQFYPELQSQMGSFDPLDWRLEGLSPVLQDEVLFYDEWTGGQFGEYPERLPRSPTWVYGRDTEPYGWIDEAAYRQAFAEAFRRLPPSPLPGG